MSRNVTTVVMVMGYRSWVIRLFAKVLNPKLEIVNFSDLGKKYIEL